MRRNPGSSIIVRSWSWLVAAVLSLLLLPATSTGQAGQYPFSKVAVAYPFTTIEQGDYSAFGYLCDPFITTDGSGPLPTGAVQRIKPPSRVPDHCYSSVAVPAFEAIFRGECAWRSFWAAHQGGEGPAPFVDFDRNVVVAVVSGPFSSGGFHLEITSISRDLLGNRRIRLRLEVPCPGSPVTLAFTNPYHFVQVAKEALPADAPAMFVHDDPFPGREARMASTDGLSAPPRF